MRNFHVSGGPKRHCLFAIVRGCRQCADRWSPGAAKRVRDRVVLGATTFVPIWSSRRSGHCLRRSVAYGSG